MRLTDTGSGFESLQIEHADDQSSQVGVYVGVTYGEYNHSGSLASVANRVSYLFNLHGPSMAVDTMCSSSLSWALAGFISLASPQTPIKFGLRNKPDKSYGNYAIKAMI